LQRALIKGGFLASGGDDGKFETQTKAAVKAYQKEKGLTQDGIAGSKTLSALAEESYGVSYLKTAGC